MNLQEYSAQEALIQERLAQINVSNENARALLELARNSDLPNLSDAMTQLEASIRRQAAIDLVEAGVTEGQYSQAQIRSMFYGRMLARAQTLPYAYFMLTYHMLRTIRNERLAAVHPAQYNHIVNGEDRSFLVMANEEAGISMSEASNIMTLGDIIIPAVREHLGWTEQEIFERINKTNLYAMIPVMRVLISQLDPDADDRQSSARVIQRAEDVQIRWAADELGVDIEIDNEALRRMNEEEQEEYLREHQDRLESVEEWLSQQDTERRVVRTMEWLLSRAEEMPTASFRQTMNPRNEDPITTYVTRQGQLRYVVAAMTEDQWETFRRVMRERANPVEVDSLQCLWEQLNE